MNSDASRMYSLMLNTFTLPELQLIYDEAMHDLEETEFLHSSLIGLTEEQHAAYRELKDDLSIYSILRERAQSMASQMAV